MDGNLKYNWNRSYFYVRNHCNVSVSFPARKSKIKFITAVKTCDILKATYSIAMLHISNENTAYLFEISSC